MSLKKSIQEYFDETAHTIHQASSQKITLHKKTLDDNITYTHVRGWRLPNISESLDYRNQQSILGFVNLYDDDEDLALELLPKNVDASPASDIIIFYQLDAHGLADHSIKSLTDRSLDGTMQFVAECGHLYKQLQAHIYQQE